MSVIDFRHLVAILVAMLLLAVLAAACGYRVEIGPAGFKFESNVAADAAAPT
jgi:hypothetical protein